MNDLKRWKRFIPIKKKKEKTKHVKLSELVNVLQNELQNLEQKSTARAYKCVLRSVMRFTNGEDLYMEELSSKFLFYYQSHMKERGNSLNTISFYMRNLRAIYNKGVKRGLYPPSPTSLFQDVYTGIDHTPKRAIGKEGISLIQRKGEEISHRPDKTCYSILISIYYFLFCFYARGMSFVDMVFLKKTDIKDNRICYRRRKTGKWLEVKLTPELKEIITFFESVNPNSYFLFPILSHQGKDWLEYQNALRKQNKILKQVALLCGIKDNLSTHVARHSWATLAKSQHIPLDVISEGLGHSSIKTTTIYLDSFSENILDHANRKVARAIKKAI